MTGSSGLRRYGIGVGNDGADGFILLGGGGGEEIPDLLVGKRKNLGKFFDRNVSTESVLAGEVALMEGKMVENNDK